MTLARGAQHTLEHPSVGVAAFLAAGKRAEACAFVDWLVGCASREQTPVRVLYEVPEAIRHVEREHARAKVVITA